jgi:hypothetical protein
MPSGPSGSSAGVPRGVKERGPSQRGCGQHQNKRVVCPLASILTRTFIPWAAHHDRTFPLPHGARVAVRVTPRCLYPQTQIVGNAGDNRRLQGYSGPGSRHCHGSFRQQSAALSEDANVVSSVQGLPPSQSPPRASSPAKSRARESAHK